MYIKSKRAAILELAEELNGKYDDLVIGMGGSAIESLPPQLKQKHNENIVGMSRIDWESCLKKRIEQMN